MRKSALLGAVLAVAFQAGCGGESKNPPPPAPAGGAAPASLLVGTEWRLVEFQSMDDSVGVKRPDDRAKYTLHLKADGTASLKLDCNSATGNWTARPSADGRSGQFELGPLAATSALCPPPSMDEEIAAQAKSIRSYLLKDGRLYLSLMADAGIYAWEPISGETAAQGDAELEAAILAASPSYVRAVVEQPGGVGKARYAVARADLNGDGTDEVFVYPMGSIFCGSGGCTLLLFTRGPDGYRLLNSLPITRLPVLTAATSSNGWKDLWKRESGGGAPATYVRHAFDGKKYIERERVPADSAPTGQPVFQGEVTFETGIPLSPRN